MNAVKHRCWSTPSWNSTLFSTTSLKAKIDEALKARYLTICCLTFQQQWCSKFSNPSVIEVGHIILRVSLDVATSSHRELELYVGGLYGQGSTSLKGANPYTLNKLFFLSHAIQKAPVTCWVFPKIGVPQNVWFIMENPITMDVWGYHYFWKHPC